MTLCSLIGVCGASLLAALIGVLPFLLPLLLQFLPSPLEAFAPAFWGGAQPWTRIHFSPQTAQWWHHWIRTAERGTHLWWWTRQRSVWWCQCSSWLMPHQLALWGPPDVAACDMCCSSGSPPLAGASVWAFPFAFAPIQASLSCVKNEYLVTFFYLHDKVKLTWLNYSIL